MHEYTLVQFGSSVHLHLDALKQGEIIAWIQINILEQSEEVHFIALSLGVQETDNQFVEPAGYHEWGCVYMVKVVCVNKRISG